MTLLFSSDFTKPWLASPGSPNLPFRPSAFWQSLAVGYKDYSGATYDVNPHNPAFASFDPFSVDAAGVLTIKVVPTPASIVPAIHAESPGVAVPPYASGIVMTNPAFARFTYGYFEWRVRWPTTARGMWPALWLVSTRGATTASAANEIDVLEVFSDPGKWYSTLHYGAVGHTTAHTVGSTPTSPADLSRWHDYGVDWQPDHITFYRDGAVTHSVTDPTLLARFDQPACAVIQYTMNPQWLGAAGAGDGKTSLEMQVQHFRVYSSITGANKMSDVFSVTGAWSAASYAKGSTITGTISGGDVLTTTSQTTGVAGPVTVPIVAADGAQSSITFASVPVTISAVTTTPESVVIDTTRPIVDSSPTPRAWLVSANKLSITAVA